ncbi:zf-TFIIB domain-containing protein [Archangium violaceum]|uniref:zf-TFIIB domain-containing protein n=1 Tax=Archangium violaceum TaxID=83451 RepID=UPI0036DC69F0
MNCPRCDKEMTPVRPDDVEARQCPQCEGHWLEGEDLRRLESTVNVRFIEWRKLPAEEVQARELACPRCEPRQVMKKVRSERDRHVLLDVCERCHGVWLDGGELRAIQEMGFVSALADVFRFVTKD